MEIERSGVCILMDVEEGGILINVERGGLGAVCIFMDIERSGVCILMDVERGGLDNLQTLWFCPWTESNSRTISEKKITMIDIYMYV